MSPRNISTHDFEVLKRLIDEAHAASNKADKAHQAVARETGRLAADGASIATLSRLTRVSRPTVYTWKDSYTNHIDTIAEMPDEPNLPDTLFFPDKHSAERLIVNKRACDGHICLGVDDTDSWVDHPINVAPHALITSRTREEKSQVVETYLQIIADNPDFYEAIFLGPATTVTTASNIARTSIDIPKSIDPTLQKISDLLAERTTELAAAGVRNHQTLRRQAVDSPKLRAKHENLLRTVFVIVDSIDRLGELPPQQAATAIRELIQVGRVGRGVGVHLVVTAQNPASDFLPPTLLGLLGFRLYVGPGSEEDSQVVLNDDYATRLHPNAVRQGWTWDTASGYHPVRLFSHDY